MTQEEPNLFFPEYSEAISYIGLESDPFPNIPPKEVTYWADNKRVYNDIRDMVASSFLFATSRIYTFWGPVGVGKTYAAKYLCKSENRKKMFEKIPKHLIKDHYVIHVTASQPRRTGELTSSIYKDTLNEFIGIILKHDELRQHFNEVYKNIDNVKIRGAFGRLTEVTRQFYEGVDYRSLLLKNVGYKYVMDEKNSIGKIQDINELAEILKWFFIVISKKYDRITLIIDELEYLASSSAAERYQFSDLIKSIYEFINSGLNVILVYTFDSYNGVAGTLQPAVINRIHDVIEFSKISEESDLIEYICDCITEGGGVPPERLIDLEVIELFSERILKYIKNISFRDINKEIHKFIAGCYRLASENDDFNITEFKITRELYELYTRFSL